MCRIIEHSDLIQTSVREDKSDYIVLRVCDSISALYTEIQRLRLLPRAGMPLEAYKKAKQFGAYYGHKLEFFPPTNDTLYDN